MLYGLKKCKLLALTYSYYLVYVLVFPKYTEDGLHKYKRKINSFFAGSSAFQSKRDSDYINFTPSHKAI